MMVWLVLTLWGGRVVGVQGPMPLEACIAQAVRMQKGYDHAPRELDAVILCPRRRPALDLPDLPEP